ncbi:hypothetical protein [Aeromonas veronii]|uniref:hypothetical protein n=1 Tax=Aeromonas veronii TaxID=654 RepID=UPI0010111FCF|nr:hypothetical protein [Aeromonas veronii]
MWRNALTLQNRHRWLLCIAVIIMWGQVQAMTVEADIKGDTFRWVSAQSSFNGAVTPSVWATPAQLVPASGFVPGATVLNSLPLSLVGPEGRNVLLTLTLQGLEYNSPEAVGMSTDNGGGSATVDLSGTLVQVKGNGLGNKRIALSAEVTPFTHVRPVFSLGSNQAIIQAFRDANAAEGTYTSQVLLPQVYEYERNGVRIRHNWTLPLTVTINYQPSLLTSVTLSSATLGVMSARYYRQGGVSYVAGDAVYTGTASGYFSNGLRLKMKSGDIYQMQGADSTSIPFSVTCDACTQQQLVDKGKLTFADLANNGTAIKGDRTSQINFSIRLDFTDVEVSTLRTGAYRGSFSILFEPDV